MSALVDIFNRALSACGVDIGVTDPDENSREAALCRLWYPTVRNNVLASAPWPSVRKTARLARIATRNPSAIWMPGDPDPKFLYAYAPPADMLIPYHLDTFARFTYGIVGASRALSCNEPTPLLHYNARIEDIALWEEGLILAVIHTLATYLVQPLTGRGQLLEQNIQLAFIQVEEAQTAAANSMHEDFEVLPEWLQVRGYGNTGGERYFYPMQTLAVGASA